MGDPVKTFLEQAEKADIGTICKGFIPEMFQREFERALENSLDPNTTGKFKRKVTLVVTIEPNEERDAFSVSAVTSSKLAPFIGESGIVFAAKRGNTLVAVNCNMDQLKLPLGEPAVRGIVKDEETAKAAKGTGTNG